MTRPRPTTRIQTRNREAILAAALDVFSAQGFRGATLDQIAEAAGLSKPNVLYYFPSKEAIHEALLTDLLEDWLAPLRAIDPAGEPVAEILAYVRAKLAMSRERPRESRLFANEILQGAPRMAPVLAGALRALVDEKAAVIRCWQAQGRLAPVHPVHLIMSVWALTQHYADFEVQVRALVDGDPWDEAERHLIHHFSRALAP